MAWTAVGGGVEKINPNGSPQITVKISDPDTNRVSADMIFDGYRETETTIKLKVSLRLRALENADALIATQFAKDAKIDRLTDAEIDAAFAKLKDDAAKTPPSIIPGG